MDSEQSPERADSESGGKSGRDIVVPMRVYKAVTVFTTLFAVATVVGGFVLLDLATDRAQATVSEIQPLVALLGIGLIVGGAAAYAFSTRFRAEGMGKSKDDTDEGSDNG
ncbi:DUF7315 family membrane protein [Halorientalis salina]|uniref:DUF7315 family membrane protein n=1 Tax=Halorientalis salina TaxID=2932266 RepID=UPI0010AB7C4C